MPRPSDEEHALVLAFSLLATERLLRSVGVRRLHCALDPADGHVVRLTGERRAAPVVYGVGADLGEAMADLFRNARQDGAR